MVRYHATQAFRHTRLHKHLSDSKSILRNYQQSSLKLPLSPWQRQKAVTAWRTCVEGALNVTYTLTLSITPFCYSVWNSYFGIGGVALDWFQSYLSGRTYCVRIDNVTLDTSQLKYGFPQSYILGPIVFSMYTSPTADIIRKHCVKYHALITYRLDTCNALLHGLNTMQLQRLRRLQNTDSFTSHLSSNIYTGNQSNRESSSKSPCLCSRQSTVSRLLTCAALLSRTNSVELCALQTSCC